jgi:16S rRNA (adenine1518-N6/adenine1519-N6)-dimethyltransferase
MVDENMRRKLVEALEVEPGSPVWEVGPGLGAETALLLEKGARVTAFEIDHGFVQILGELFAKEIASGQLTLVEGDVLDTWTNYPPPNGAALARSTPRKGGGETASYSPPLAGGVGGGVISFFGNLPYNIAQLLLGSFLENGMLFSRMVVTVQKEVAARFGAQPGSKNYCALSVLTSFFYSVKNLARLPPSCFYPMPKVESSAVLLTRNITHEPHEPHEHKNDIKMFSSIIRALFAARRKTVANNLNVWLKSRSINADAKSLCEKAEISPVTRAEQLEPSAFLNLVRVVRVCAAECAAWSFQRVRC